MSVHNKISEVFKGEMPNAAFFDLDAWPIAFVRFPELNEEERLEHVLGGLEHLLRQQIPFVVAWIPASHDHDDEPHEDEIAANKWIKRHREMLNKYCRGYVYVTQNPALASLLKERIKTISGKLFKFPMKVVSERENAVDEGRVMLEPAE